MNSYNNGLHAPKRRLKLSRSLLCAAFILFVTSGVVLGKGDPAPTALENLSMGISSSALIDKIKSIGTHSMEPSPWDERKKVIWRLPADSSYDKVMFLFTQKDRLCLVRFVVKKEAWSEVPNLKKALFEMFGISLEKPGRLRVKNQDIMVYHGLKSDYSFFEFTDAKTGEKAFELYDRKVSAEDRPKKDATSKNDSRK